MGHPRIFINVDKPQICFCTYCGLPFVSASCEFACRPRLTTASQRRMSHTGRCLKRNPLLPTRFNLLEIQHKYLSRNESRTRHSDSDSLYPIDAKLSVQHEMQDFRHSIRGIPYAMLILPVRPLRDQPQYLITYSFSSFLQRPFSRIVTAVPSRQCDTTPDAYLTAWVHAQKIQNGQAAAAP